MVNFLEQAFKITEKNMLHLKKEFSIPASYTDAHAQLTTASTVAIMQDLAGRHAELMGVGFHDLKEKSGAFWVIIRTKIKVLRPARIYEDVIVETWPSKPSGIVCLRNYRISAPDGEVLAVGKNEWVVIDAESHKLRRLNSTCYPVDEEYSDEVTLDEPFLKVYEAASQAEYVYTHRVRYSDTDHVRHTNNVAYIRILTDALPSEYFEEHIITDFEIKYIHESREGEDISVYAKPTEDGYFLFGKNPSGEDIVAARLTSKKR